MVQHICSLSIAPSQSHSMGYIQVLFLIVTIQPFIFRKSNLNVNFMNRFIPKSIDKKWVETPKSSDCTAKLFISKFQIFNIKWNESAGFHHPKTKWVSSATAAPAAVYCFLIDFHSEFNFKGNAIKPIERCNFTVSYDIQCTHGVVLSTLFIDFISYQNACKIFMCKIRKLWVGEDWMCSCTNIGNSTVNVKVVFEAKWFITWIVGDPDSLTKWSGG